MDVYLGLQYAQQYYELRVKAEERAWRYRPLVQKAAGPAYHALAWIGELLVTAGKWLQQSYMTESGRV